MGFVRRAITSALDLANLKRHNDNFADIETDLTEHRGRIAVAETKLNTQSDRIDNIVASSGESNLEIVDAREDYGTLRERLNTEFGGVNAQLAETATKEELISGLAPKADQSYVDTQFANIVSGSPKGTYTTLEALQTALPTGAEGTFLVLADGHWYFWDGTAWTSGGVYQSTGIAEGAVKLAQLNAEVKNPLVGVTESFYKYKSGSMGHGGSVKDNGILKVSSAQNNAELATDNIFVNEVFIANLLPSEYIFDGKKYSLYERRRLKDYNFSAATVDQMTTDTARVRISISGSYSLDPSMYNIISESTKFVSKKQVDSSSTLTNYILLHQSSTLEFRVLRNDTLAGGYNWDVAGIRAYMQGLTDFIFHIRKSSYVSTGIEVPTVFAKAGEIVNISKLSTTTAIMDAYTDVLVISGDYSYKKFEASVKNAIGIDYVNKPIKLYASFAAGECLNENCIIVKTSLGTVVPHQWESDRFVNYKYDKDMGRYPDGSLKDGYIWISDNLPAGASKTYEIYVYPIEVVHHAASVLSLETFNSTTKANDVTLQTAPISLAFRSANKYLAQTVTVNGSSLVYEQNPAYNLTLGNTTYVKTDTNAQATGYSVEGSGVVFKDITVTIAYSNMFDLVIKTRMFKSGLIQEQQYFKAKRQILSTELYGVFHRTNLTVGTGTSFTSYGTTLYGGTWLNGDLRNSVHILFNVADKPRGSSGTPLYPAVGVIATDTTRPEVRWFITGWRYQSGDTTYAIPKGQVFTSGMEINLIGVADASTNEIARSFNPLVGRITDSTRYRLKSDILGLIIENISNTGMDFDEKSEGKPFDAFYPSFLNRLALWKLFGLRTLDEISNDYKALINSKFGGNNVETMFTMYKTSGSGFTLDLTARVFPVAEYLLAEYEKLSDAAEVTYYSDLIKAYAEVLCRAVEQTGGTGLTYSSSLNSNGVTSGLRGLSQGIKLDPTNTRWITAYTTNYAHLASFMLIKNICTDSAGAGANVTLNHYIPYTAYTYFELAKALENMSATPTFDLSVYPFTASSAYGAISEQEYCVSSNRRGTMTYAYVVYLMIKENTTSSLAHAKRLMERIIELNKPRGGHEFPLEDWDNPTSEYDTAVSIELQVLGETLFYLLGSSVKLTF